MHIRKFDFDFARRHFLNKTAAGIGGAGVLGSLWAEVCRAGDARGPVARGAQPDIMPRRAVQGEMQ